MYFLCQVIGTNNGQSKRKAAEELMLSSCSAREECWKSFGKRK